MQLLCRHRCVPDQCVDSCKAHCQKGNCHTGRKVKDIHFSRTSTRNKHEKAAEYHPGCSETSCQAYYLLLQGADPPVADPEGSNVAPSPAAPLAHDLQILWVVLDSYKDPAFPAAFWDHGNVELDKKNILLEGEDAETFGPFTTYHQDKVYMHEIASLPLPILHLLLTYLPRCTCCIAWWLIQRCGSQDGRAPYARRRPSSMDSSTVLPSITNMTL